MDLPEHLLELQEKLAADPTDAGVRTELGGGLLELGHPREGLAHLVVAAELRAEDEEFPEAIALLNRVLEVAPQHDKARQLLSRFYARVPRQPTAKLKAPGSTLDSVLQEESEDGEYGAELFSLPDESMVALAQLLPFADEDPKPIVGEIAVRLPEAPSESPQPFLAVLEKELRRGPISGIDIPIPPHEAKLPVIAPPENPDDALDAAFREGIAEVEGRISPASSILKLDDIPPNQIIGLLETGPLNALLGRIDALRFSAGEVALSGESTGHRALYIVVKGRFEVRRERTSDGKKIAISELLPGDFYGEFELLTVATMGAEVVALEDTLVLELPARTVNEMADRVPELRQVIWDSYFNRSFHSMMSTSEIFSGLANAVVTRISFEFEPLLFEPGDIVLRAGEVPRGLYGLVGGSLAVMRARPGPSSVLTRLSPGDFFGIASSATGEPVLASVVASEDSTVLWLPPAQLQALKDSVPDFTRTLADATRGRLWKYRLMPPSPG